MLSRAWRPAGPPTALLEAKAREMRACWSRALGARRHSAAGGGRKREAKLAEHGATERARELERSGTAARRRPRLPHGRVSGRRVCTKIGP